MDGCIQNITISRSVRVIEKEAFRDCEELENVLFAENSQLETIEELAFSGSSLEKITIPNSVTTI